MSRLADLRDEQQEFAMIVLLETDVLRTCEIHEHITMNGGADIEEAYDLGEERFNSDENSVPFDSVDEMKEEIRKVYIDHSFNDSCELCAKWERD